MAAFLALGPPLPAALPPALLSSPPASLSHPEPPVPLLARSPGSQAASPPAADPLKQAGQKETREALQGQLHRDSRVPGESFLLTRHSLRAPQQDPGGCGAALTPSPAPLGLPWAFPFSRSLLSTHIPSCRAARTRPSHVPKMPTLGSPLSFVALTLPEGWDCSRASCPPRSRLLPTPLLCSPARSGHKPQSQPMASSARCHQPREVPPCPSPGREGTVGASCCVTLRHTAGCAGTLAS